MRCEYQLLDVFTKKPYGGNQLAVFQNSAAIAPTYFQSIARELNLPECAFASPVWGCERQWYLRIFTPKLEHPFAGHPTIGAAIVLASSVATPHEKRVSLLLHEKSGIIAVEVDFTPEVPTARMSVPTPPSCEKSDVSRQQLAAMLSIEESDIGCGDWHPQVFSCGVPFHIVYIKTLSAIRSARLRLDLWQRYLKGSSTPHLYLFTRETEATDADIHARMFAPAMGIDEDAATGGAAAALAGYLAATERAFSGKRKWRIEQGLEILRPSWLEVTAEFRNGAATDIKIGGSAITIGGGFLELPSTPNNSSAAQRLAESAAGRTLLCGSY